MAQFIAAVVAVVSTINMFLVLHQALNSTPTTVFQQIAERLNIGLTALVLVVSVGIYSIIGYLHRAEKRSVQGLSAGLVRTPLPNAMSIEAEAVAAATPTRPEATAPASHYASSNDNRTMAIYVAVIVALAAAGLFYAKANRLI